MFDDHIDRPRNLAEVDHLDDWYGPQLKKLGYEYLTERRNGKDDILKFGEQEEAEQMLQILNSDEIRNRIIEKYDLINHYGIDDDYKYKKTELQAIYESNINVDMNKFMAVEIEVLDYDATIAALIANDIAALLDTVKNRMRREIAVSAFTIVSKRYNEQKETWIQKFFI